MQVTPPPFGGDTTFVKPDTMYPAMSPDTLSLESALSIGDTTQRSLYDERTYVARGPADEIREIPFYFVQSPGPVGSPAIPVEYLNVAGAEVTLNGLPFPYNGIYRPYLIGTDLNTIPWEILNDIRYAPRDLNFGGLDFLAGRPPDLENRSDVEIGRGPYGYTSSRWRFFRPFGKKTYAYFNVGFKKSDGFIENSDYDGYHATGGILRKIGSGQLGLDIWTHRAKTGLNSFDFAVSQQSRQSRAIHRGEARYDVPLGYPFYLNLTGLYHRSAQTISGYTNPVKTKLDITGGKITVFDSLSNATLAAEVEYYRLNLYGIADRKPSEDIVNTRVGADGEIGNFGYLANVAFAWNSLDHGELLPTLKVSYRFASAFEPFALSARTRPTPNLYLRNVTDAVPGLGMPGFLQSYTFSPNPDLSTPEISLAVLGVQSDFGSIVSQAGIAYRRIHSQVKLSYSADTLDNFIVTPINYDDRYLELFADVKGDLGPLSGQASGAFRRWDDKYFSDGLEKGPVAIGYGRLSFRRQVFIPRLFLGASIEGRFSSRRDYRSITTGFTDAFAALFGRLEFQYKDLSFWLNEDNITNTSYATLYPYFEGPRTVWWGLRWRFFD